MSLLLATNVHPLTGDLCVDFPGYCDIIDKTSANISPLYQLDAFDWTVLIIYFGILTVLAIYGVYRVKQVIDFWRYSRFPPKAKGEFAAGELPHITVQLPLFNEMYVVERLVKAVTEIDYPHDRIEIQVLDDSTDETIGVAQEIVERYARGFAGIAFAMHFTTDDSSVHVRHRHRPAPDGELRRTSRTTGKTRRRTLTHALDWGSSQRWNKDITSPTCTRRSCAKHTAC